MNTSYLVCEEIGGHEVPIIPFKSKERAQWHVDRLTLLASDLARKGTPKKYIIREPERRKPLDEPETDA